MSRHVHLLARLKFIVFAIAMQMKIGIDFEMDEESDIRYYGRKGDHSLDSLRNASNSFEVI